MRVLLLCFALAACTSHSTTHNPDAAVTHMDGSGGGTACTGAAFDPCTDNTQCMSMNCHLYMQSAIQVCTQACTPGDNTTCPLDVTGAHALCNGMGLCKPAAANNCTR